MRRFTILALVALTFGLTGAARDIRKPLVDMFQKEVSTRAQCALDSGLTEACALAPIVASGAALEACWEANRPMCIVDTEIVLPLTEAAPVGLTITYPALLMNTTIYFAEGGRLVCDNASGTEITASQGCLLIMPDLALEDSFTRVINPRVSERRNGEDVGWTVTASGTATAGGNNTLTDTVGGFVSAAHTDDVVVLRPGTATEEYSWVSTNTTTALTMIPDWQTNPSAGDEYQVRTSGTMELFQFKNADQDTRQYVEVINPELITRAHADSSITFGQNGDGCTHWYVRGGHITGPIGMDMKGQCDGTDSVSTTVDDTTEIITDVAHGLEDGEVVFVSAAVNGLSLLTRYYVEELDADTYHLHTSLADAVAAATPIDLTGTTNFTATPLGMTTAYIDGTTFDGYEFTDSARAIKLFNNVRVTLKDVLIYKGYINLDGGGGAFVDLQMDGVSFIELNAPAIINNTGAGHANVEGDMDVFNQAPVAGGLSVPVDDLIQLFENGSVSLDIRFHDCALPDQLLDTTGTSGTQAVRIFYETPLGCDFPTRDQVVSSRSDTEFTARSTTGAIIGRGGSNKTMTMIAGTSSDEVTVPVTDSVVATATLASGDDFCAQLHGLACVRVFDHTNNTVDACATAQVSSEVISATCAPWVP